MTDSSRKTNFAIGSNQLDWVILDRKTAVDFIGRFERLEKDFAYVCKKLNVQLTLLRTNVSARYDDYRRAYKMTEIVADWHARDIEYFGYEFNEAEPSDFEPQDSYGLSLKPRTL